MIKINNNILFFISFLYIKKIFISCIIPNAPQYESYDSEEKKIKIKADEIEDLPNKNYKFTYIIEDEEKTEENPQNTIDIICEKGKQILIYYSYSTSSMVSENSPKSSFYCATVPSIIDESTINYFTSTENKVFLSWNPPSDDGGTPIQNYLIKYREKNNSGTSSEPSSDFKEISSNETSIIINENIESGNIYEFYIYPVNYIVSSIKLEFLENIDNAAKKEIEIKKMASSKNCLLSGSGLENFSSTTPSVEIILEAYNNNNEKMTSVESIFMLQVQDYCILKNENNKFVCERQINENTQNIFESEEDYIIKTFDKVSDTDGDYYSAKYSIFGNGKITIFVYQLIRGGLLGQYYDNVWFLEPFIKEKVDYKIDFKWEENANIINNLNDFISIRWIGALLSPENNLFTFSISSDDGIRIYLNNKNVFDHLNSPCDSCYFEYNMKENQFYLIKIEFVQLQGPSRIKLFWQTSSRPKEIIPSEFLFFPEIVKDTPKTLEISNDNIHPAKCYVEKHEKIVYVGKISKINIIPVNSNDEKIIINNNNVINFDIRIINKAESNKKGNLYFQSKLDNKDTSNPYFYAEFIPLVPGEYIVEIKFGTIPIKNSPYDIIVKHGEVSPIYSIVDDKDNISPTKAGLIIKLKLNLYDVMNNKYYSEPDFFPVNIKFIAHWTEREIKENECSAKGISDENELSKEYAGNVKSNNDGTYELTISPLKSGKYDLKIYINQQLIKDGPFSLDIEPSIIDATKCISIDNQLPLTAGSNYQIHYQCKDTYGNNIDNNDFEPEEVYLILNGDSGIKIRGDYDNTGKFGCYLFKFDTIEKSGIYKTKFIINQLLIPQIEIVVNPSSPSHEKSYVEIINYKSKYFVGDNIQLKMTCLDKYENLIKEENKCSFKIKSADDIISDNSLKYEGNGIYIFSKQFTSAGTYTFKVFLITGESPSEIEIKNSHISNVILYPGKPREKSIIKINENVTPTIQSFIAGETITSMKALLKDEYENIIEEQGNEKIYLDFMDKNNISNTFTFEGKYIKTSDNYNYLFDNVLLTKATDYSISLKITDNFGLIGYYYQSTDFYNLLNKIERNYHKSLNNIDKSYTRIDPEINFSPIYLSFTDDLPFEQISIEWKGYLKSNTSEMYTIYLDIFGKALLYLDNELVINYMESINGFENVGEKFTPNFVNVYLKKDELIPIKLIYIKNKDEILSKIIMSWESDSIQKQIIPQSNLYCDLYNEDEQSINIKIAKTDIESLEIINEKILSKCILDNENKYSFRFILYDIFGNEINENRIDEDISIKVYLIKNKDQSVLIYCVIDFDITKGEYVAECEVNEEGNYNLEIEISYINEGIKKLYNNYELFTCSKNSDLDLCKEYIIDVTGLTQSIAGEESSFTLIFVDDKVSKNIIYSCANVVFLSSTIISKPDESYKIPVSVVYDSSIDSENYGKFIFSYTGYKVSKYAINIFLNNNKINEELEMDLSPGKPSNELSKYISIQSSNIKMGDNFAFEIKLYDSYSNPVNNIDYEIYSEIKGKFGIYKKILSTKESDSFLYKVSFNIERVNDTFSGCGIGTLSSFILKKGVRINYFNNYFVNGNPFISEVKEDGKIELDLGTDDLLGNLYDKLYTSIQYMFYFKPDNDDDIYHFLIYTNGNNIRLYFDDELAIDSFSKPLLSQYSFTTSEKLKKEYVYSFRLNIYIRETTVKFFIKYYSEGNAELKLMDIMNNCIFYSDKNPIENKKNNINFYSNPGKIEKIYQDFDIKDKIRIKWEKPNDDGCNEIKKYKIYLIEPNKEFVYELNPDDLNKNLLSYDIDDLAIELNKEYQFQISAINVINGNYLESTKSNIIVCKLTSYPISNLKIIKSTENENDIAISWDPISISTNPDEQINYHLEYCLSNSIDNFKEIYSGSNPKYEMSARSNNLKYGQEYKFRVYAETEMGKGDYSNTETFIYSGKPEKPPSPPKIDLSKTTKDSLEFTFDPIIQNNGAQIEKYIISININGKEIITKDIQVTDTNSNIYRVEYIPETSDKYFPIIVKYLAENKNGKGPFSDPSLPMYAAIKPDKPENLMKDFSSPQKGIIKIKWEKPNSDGGAPILGYKIYLNDIYITSVQSNIYKYSFQNIFDINDKNKIAISAYNIIGESEKFEVKDIDSTVVPGKINSIKLDSYSPSSLTILWEEPNDNGGLRQLSYGIRINDGSEIGNNFGVEENAISILKKTFESLSPSKYYTIQVRAYNSNGGGEWSDYFTFFTGESPGAVQNFNWEKSLSDKSKIVLTWESPLENGGCDIYGYKIYNGDGTPLYNGKDLFFIFDSKYNIIPSNYYYFEIYAYNCAYQSTEKKSVYAYSAKVPEKMNPINFNKYDSSAKSLSILYDHSFYDGGLPIKNFIINLICINCINEFNKDITITDFKSNEIIIKDELFETGKKYKIKISAENEVGIGDMSDEEEIILDDIPKFPNDYKFEVNCENDEFNVNWGSIIGSIDNPIGYRIYLSENYIENNKLNNYTLIYDTFRKGPIFHYVLNSSKLNLIESKLYHIYLTAYNFAGETEPVYTNFYYGKLPPTPYALSLYDIIEKGANKYNIVLGFKININTAILPIKKYMLKNKNHEEDIINIRYDKNNLDIILIDHEESGINIGDIDTYYLKAVNDVGEGEWSYPLEVIYSVHPKEPGDISIKKRLNKSSLIITWKEDEKIENNIETLGYVIYFNSIFLYDRKITTNCNEYTLKDLIPGKEYQITIKSINKLGESYSGSNFIFPAGLIPSKVLNVRRQSYSENGVKIIFDPPEDDGGWPITSYKCMKIINGEDKTKKTILINEATSSSALYVGLESNDLENDKATFYIIATNIIGDGPEEKDIYTFYKGKVPSMPKDLKVNQIIPIENKDGELSQTNFCNAYIKWNAPEKDNGSPIYKYQILIMNNSNNEYELLDNDISPSLINNYLIKNLLIGREYKLQISAFNLIGQGDLYYKSFSTIFNPSPPLNLTIISQENGKIEISWTKPLFINGQVITNYLINYQDMSISSDNIEMPTNSINTLYNLNSLNINHKYKIYIKSKNEKYKSDSSNIVYGYAVNPPKIDDLTPSSEVITPNSIKISWTNQQESNEDIEMPPLIGYEVYIRDIDKNFDYKLIYDGKYVDNVFETIADGLINGHNYGIVYYAYSKVGRSNMSKEKAILCATPPSPPEGLVLKSVSNSKIVISWHYSDTMNSNLVPLKGFYIYNEEDKIKCKYKEEDSNTDSDSYLIPLYNNSCEIDAEENKIYKLRISAENKVHESEKSVNILTVKAVNVPEKPTLKLNSFDYNYCELSFESKDNSNTQKNFVLYLKNNTNNELSILYEGNLKSYKHENLSSFTQYYYTLSEKNEGGESSRSSLIECITYPLCSPPEKLHLIKSDYSSIELKWNPPSEVYTQITEYKLYMKSDVDEKFKNIKSDNILNYEVRNNVDNIVIAAKKQYEFYVTAVDIYGRESLKSNVGKFYCASVPNKVTSINIDEIIKPNKIKLSWRYEPYTEPESEFPNLYYKIYYKDETIQNSNYEIIKVADIINNYYILDNLLYGHTYSFYISAVNQVGEGEISDIINKKLIFPPDPPDIFYIEDVVLANDNICVVSFAWKYTKNIYNDQNKSIIKYKIKTFKLGEIDERIEGPDKTIEITEINFSNLMTCDIEGFEKDEKYEIIITSCSIDEAESDEFKITKKIILKPKKVENINVNDNSRSRTSLGITWDKNENENFYHIYILSNEEGNTFSQNDYIISYKNEYLFTNLEKGKNLEIQIEAVNEIGTGPKSDAKSIPIYGLPDSPTNIYISSKTKNQITINFSPTNENGGSPIQKYILYRSTNSLFINKENIHTFDMTDNNINTNILTYTDPNLSPCNLYYYTSTSVNELGESEIDQNSIINAFTQISPSHYSADLNIIKIGNNSFYINWKEIDEENNGGCKNDIIYTLYMKAAENSEYSEIYSGNNVYYTVENLDLWKKYKFKLVVGNSINSVEIEEKESLEYTGYLLPPPKNLRLIERKISKSTETKTITVKIKWDIIKYDSSFINYEIYYSNSIYSNNNYPLSSLGINQNEFELKNSDYSDLIEGKYIYFYITTKNLIGEGPKSSPLRVLVGQIPSSPQKELTYFANSKLKSITLQIPSLSELGDIYGDIIPSRYIIKMNDKIVINSTSNINTINNLKLGNTYIFTYALSNIIYEEDNSLNESLNFGGETAVELLPIPEQVQNLRFGKNKNKIYPDKVKIEWDPIIITNESLLLKFIIYQSCLECSSDTEIKEIVADASSSSKLIEDLIPGTKYSFYITGKYQGNLEGPKSNIIVFTSGIKPSKLETPTLVEFTSSSIKIKIKTSLSDIQTGGIDEHRLEIVKFIIYKNGHKYEEKSENDLSKDTEGYSEYTFNYLVKGEEYYIQISCVNIFGESELSDILIVTPSYHPSAPLNLQIVSQSYSEIKLSWDEPFDNGGLPISSYEINIKEKDISSESKNQEVQDTFFLFSKEGGEGKGYIFKVRAINKYSIDNNSDNDQSNYKWTEEVTGYLISIPSPVQDLAINEYDKYHGVLTWTPLSQDVDKGYSSNIEYILNVKYDNIVINEPVINNLISYDFKVPILGMKYYFKIIAKNEVGSSESNQIEIIFTSKPKKMKPLVLESMSVFTDPPYIKLSWEDDITNQNIKNELQYYLISMKKENDANIKNIYEENNIDNKILIIYQNKGDNSNPIITPGEIYYFYISVKSNRGFSELSEGLEVIFVEAPQSITLVKNIISNDNIEIKWSIESILNGGSEITGFIIQKKLSIISNYEDDFNLTICSTSDDTSCSSNLESKTITKDNENYFSIKFTNSHLNKGSYYNFRIAPYNKFINKLDLLNFNEPLSILFATKPNKITTFEQVFDNLKQNQVNLRWEPPNDNGGTKILKYIITKTVNEISSELPSISSDKNYYEDNDVESDIVKYSIRSVNAAGESDESEIITCHPGLKPGKVLNLITTSVNKDKIKVQFNKPDISLLNCQITNFEISYKIGDSDEKKLEPSLTYDNQEEIYEFELSINTDGANSYEEGTQITFKVYGVNSLGEGEIEELTTYNCNDPKEPAVFSIYKRRETGIDFYFKPNNEDLEKLKNNGNCKLTKFQLYRNNDIACKGSSRLVKCSIDNLENGSSYDFKLIYYNNVGGKSEPKKIENCKIGVPPNEIGNLKIDKIEIVEGSSDVGNIDISWDRDTSNNNNLATKYYVLYAQSESNYPSENLNNYMTQNNYQNLTNLGKGEKYKIKVYAENDIGKGKESELEQIVDNPPEMNEENIEFSEINCTSFTIKWKKVDSSSYSVKYYNIYKNREIYHNFNINEGNDNQDNYQFSIDNLEKLKSYQIGINAVNEIGESNMIIKPVKTCITNRIITFNIEPKEGENNEYIIRWDYDQDQNNCYCNVSKSVILIYKNEINDSNIIIENQEIFINEYEFNLNNITTETKLIFKIIIYDENGKSTDNEYEWQIPSGNSGS